MRQVLPCTAALLVVATIATAQQPLWVKGTGYLTGRSGAALAFDATRQEVILFGGWDGTLRDDTWIWKGTQWIQKFPAVRPPRRSDHALAFDGAAGQVLLFGGWSGSGCLNDTWHWDGSAWARKTPGTSPPPRCSHAMAYDAARGEVVLFGGWSGSTYLGDTWIWDGNNWVQKATAHGPSARAGHILVYDTARREVVLFAGGTSSEKFNDTWVWNGSDWVQKSPLNKPPARQGHAAAFDAARNELVMFGGYSSVIPDLNDTWIWDGTNWVEKATSSLLFRRAFSAMAYDAPRGRVVLFGGRAAGTYGVLVDTWAWDGSSWTPYYLAPESPGSRSYHALAFDAARQQTVLFGGQGPYAIYSDTWIFDGLKWAWRNPSRSPGFRYGHAMAYDWLRRTVVLFGGWTGSSSSNETWLWDGSAWQQRLTSSSPSPRYGHALAFDPTSGGLLLHGGYDSGYLDDTWLWDGTNWVRLSPATQPPARYHHAMACDLRRGHVVLFGGISNGAFLNDTWIWNGTNWVRAMPATNPPPRAYHAMSYDYRLGGVVLFGGASSSFSTLKDTWFWDGTNWLQMTPESQPPARYGHALAYDGARGTAVLFGGGHNNDTWLYRIVPVTLAPQSTAPGSGSDTEQEFDLVFEHPSGWQQFQVLNALLNFWLDGRQACYVAYVPATQALYLVDDWGNAGGPFAGGLILGQDTGTIGNSQCTIDGSQSWAEHDGKQVRLHLKVSFSSSFAGTRIWYLAARDATNNSGWQRLGVWKVPGATSLPGYPEVVELYPAEWTGRDPETLEVTVRDPQGAGDVGVVNVLVNDWLDGRQACYVAYVPAANAVFLVDDAGNAGGPFAGGVVLGSSQTAANSQCTIYGEGSSASATGERLTLRLRVQFKSGFAGNRVVYGAVRDLANNNSGWQAMGRRTVP